MNELVHQDQGFGAMARTSDNAIATSDEARAIQQVQAAMVIAKRFPRNQIQAVDRIRNACTRPKLAEKGLYYYKRGGSAVTGPSIRLAEVLAQEWGNLQSGVRELSQSNGVSTVEAFAWDLETNFYETKVFQVPHTRYSKEKGNEKLTDPRDIYEHIANMGARRKRACILAVIPGDVVEEAVDQCGVTQKANIDMSSEKIKGMVDYFGGYGVTQEAIEKRLGKRIDAMVPAQMMMLRNIAESMKDGMSKPADWFEVGDVGEGAAGKVSDINVGLGTKEKPAKKQKPAAAPKTDAEQEKLATEEEKPAAESADQGATTEAAGKAVTSSAEEAGPADDNPEANTTYAQIADVLNKADSPEALSAAVERMTNFLEVGDNDQFRGEMTGLYRARLKTLKSKA